MDKDHKLYSLYPQIVCTSIIQGVSFTYQRWFNGGLSLTEIVKAAGWTNVKTFGKFFDKQVTDKNSVNFLLTNSL